jgi:hypothetical protein
MSVRPAQYNNTSALASVPKVLIFDWDDTLFPSSFVDKHEADHYSDFPANVRRAS